MTQGDLLILCFNSVFLGRVALISYPFWSIYLNKIQMHFVILLRSLKVTFFYSFRNLVSYAFIALFHLYHY